jgi:hypothetical protein
MRSCPNFRVIKIDAEGAEQCVPAGARDHRESAAMLYRRRIAALRAGAIQVIRRRKPMYDCG